MAGPEKETDDKFVEVDGVKYQEDPENEGEALIGDDGKFVPFEEKEEGFVEIDGEKFKEDPDNIGEPLKDTSGKPIPFKEEKKEEKEEKEPSLRKSAKDHIIERKTKKIEKLEKKKKDDEDEDEDEDEDDDGEVVTPKGKKAIDKAVKERVDPVLKKLREDSIDTKDEAELQKVLNNPDYPNAKEMEVQIRKHMKAYPNAPVEFIYLGLAAKKLGLQKKRDKADEDAKGDELGGHGRRKKELGPIPDVREWSDEKIGELVQKIQTGQV